MTVITPSLGIQTEQDSQFSQITDSSGNPIISSELNSLLGSGLVISTVIANSGIFTNTATYLGYTFQSGVPTGNGAPSFRMHLHANFVSGAALANSVVDGWFLCQPDSATNMETWVSGLVPTRIPDFSFPVGGLSGAFDVEQVVAAPICSYAIRTLVRNNSTGTSMASGIYLSGNANYIRCYPVTKTMIGPGVSSPTFP